MQMSASDLGDNVQIEMHNLIYKLSLKILVTHKKSIFVT